MLDTAGVSDRSQFDEVLQIKEQANAKVKEGDYFSAKCLYSGALELLERCCLHVSKADETWEGIKNNMALCDLKRSEWTRVVDQTTEVLQRNPASTKALYRRALAYSGQEKLSDALKDLKALVALEPKNAEAIKRLNEVQRKVREQRGEERQQAEKLRGFLRGEHLNDTVPITRDGGIRKLHGNENRPLLASWIKREWLDPASGKVAVVTCHIVIKTQTGTEVFNTRKPTASVAGGAAASSSTSRIARFVLDDRSGAVFEAWNTAVKSVELNEVGKFEIAKHTLGPSVEPAVQRCMEQWTSTAPEMFKDLPEEVRRGAKRQQALQVLCLPEELCPQTFTDPDSTVNMELELVDVSEFEDPLGDGTCLLRWQSKSTATRDNCVQPLSTVAAHFKLSKLLLDVSLADSRLGLVQTCDGLVMKADLSKPAVSFIVGEEDAGASGEFVPPCVGRSLLLPPEGVGEGSELALILRNGVPFSETEKSASAAFAAGLMANTPDLTGPVLLWLSVEKVAAPSPGPADAGWGGLAQLQGERRRAEELLQLDEGRRHAAKALRRCQRIVAWIEAIPGAAAEAGGSADPEAFDASRLAPEELVEWATAHSMMTELLGPDDGSGVEEHARKVVAASVVTKLASSVEVRARLALGSLLLERGADEEALDVLRVAQEVDTANATVRNRVVMATQRVNAKQACEAKSALLRLHSDLSEALAADDAVAMTRVLEELDKLQFTWAAASEVGLGKEVGKCSKHSDPSVSALARTLVGKLQKLAQHSRQV